MAAKGSLWSIAEVQCLLEIWADDSIQEQLDTTHKNSEIFGKIRDYLHARGYQRSIEQCRDKVKKLRIQYLKIRDALRKSGSSSDEKEKFQWYDIIDKIIGLKPSSEPNVFESYAATPSAASDSVDTESPPELNITSFISDHTNTGNESCNSGSLDITPPEQCNKRRKRKKMDVSDMMEAFLDMQKKHYDEFMRGEELHLQKEREMLNDWMKAQMEMEERRQQMQREERQEANRMFQQMMNRMFDAMVPIYQQHTPSHPNKSSH
ncbi:zinc finger and SCAN domain-containing protein 32-like isoform X2 [Erpetoichthys calabaricus]|uniref:zinc finger and SCAN domain-containing protein 32-like isoform X2 n=1 Tax=Erpetoichthys calabaricus TaxID=27687 RepID=UPI0022349CD0|nr:zinc finger and SCAN domain-containing protein 32-like isoform X2 [Erpetoichthys calabaricus]